MKHTVKSPFPVRTKSGDIIIDEKCTCGHLRSEHADGLLSFGHRECPEAGCIRFTWSDFVIQKKTPAKKLSISEVKTACKAAGVPCQWKPETREYVVNGYFTDDGQDAIDTAREMAKTMI